MSNKLKGIVRIAILYISIEYVIPNDASNWCQSTCPLHDGEFQTTYVRDAIPESHNTYLKIYLIYFNAKELNGNLTKTKIYKSNKNINFLIKNVKVYHNKSSFKL